MPLRDILRWPDPRLSERCSNVGPVTPETTKLAEDLCETMYAAPGRGLAAPQIGVLQRVFVMDLAGADGPRTPRVFIDPEIIWRGETVATGPEGCLSIPGVTARVARAQEIEVTWTGLDGVRHTGFLSDMEAVCAQHEIDHLDGIVTLDRLGDADRQHLESLYFGEQDS